MKKILTISILLSLLLFSCKDPYADSIYSTVASKMPAATYMEKTDSLNVSMWVQLLKYTDLFNTINLQANYTCFVPNNKAMEAYLKVKNVSSIGDLKMDDAKLLVRYHTIKGTKYNSIDFSEGVIPDTTATGDYLSTAFLNSGGAIQLNTEATIQQTVTVTNAYIHIIDNVLTPVTETLWDKIQAPGFSIMNQAIEATGFKEKLNTVTVSEINPITGFSSLRKYHYTLFAVSDATFIANGITDMSSLIIFLNAGTDYTSTQNALYSFVAYHLLNQQVSFSELSAFAANDKVRSKNINTMAQNQLINVSDVSGELFINYEKTTSIGVKLALKNKNCKNGVMHIVDNLMTIKSPKPTKIQWELTSYPQLASIVPNYQIASGTTTYTYYLSSNSLTCYKYLTIPESRIGLYYVIANKNDAVRIKALHSDYLVLSLGMFGYIEMESPTIVAGKYNVYAEHFNAKGTGTAQGKLSFILDGNYVGNQITTTGTIQSDGKVRTGDLFTKPLLGTVTFTETTTHKLRILAGDTYESYLDCLTFEPITQ